MQLLIFLLALLLLLLKVRSSCFLSCCGSIVVVARIASMNLCVMVFSPLCSFVTLLSIYILSDMHLFTAFAVPHYIVDILVCFLSISLLSFLMRIFLKFMAVLHPHSYLPHGMVQIPGRT